MISGFLYGDQRSSANLRSAEWQFRTDVAGQPTGSMFKYQGALDCLILIVNYNHWGFYNGDVEGVACVTDTSLMRVAAAYTFDCDVCILSFRVCKSISHKEPTRCNYGSIVY